MDWIVHWWNSIPEPVKPIVIFLISGLIWICPSIYFTNRFNAFLNSRRSRFEERLHKHFEELQNEAKTLIQRIQSVNSSYGRIDFSQLLPQISDALKAHFTNNIVKLNDFHAKIIAHNESHSAFRMKIMQHFNSQGLRTQKQGLPHERYSYIYESIIEPLFMWWKAQVDQRGEATPNFNRLVTNKDKADLTANNLFAEGWYGSAIAHFLTEEDLCNCIQTITEVASSSDYSRDA
ncbi:MAG: hypothetical protein MUO97_11090, partial [Dehalococcoidia bacterium]|nr:hypothetical protein [Dehalococcoidia bacterium]